MPDTFVRSGGVFVAALSAFPMKVYLDYASQINAMTSIKDIWVQLAASPTASEADLARLQDLVWRLFEKKALG